MTEKKELHIDESIKPYLNEIAERLLSGHAALMVGAGFSKNGKCNTLSNKQFPDWNQLGNLFHRKIYGCEPSPTQNYLNVLKLADEVQAAFGRPALDQLLRSSIPDKDFEPSPLHITLLELPWADVFTTNFDTLLERACAFVSSQKYDIVINKEDLVYSEKPRIIKLHGSFPSERPFIITEEDYRKYPHEYAPFVNTVQQALLENTLCLIGFSGDDPNFLQWIGWIRDNLGKENSPKIFLVGIFNLSDAQIKLLAKRNIVLVDLTSCPGVGNDHTKALDLFFKYLHSKKVVDENRLDWPGRHELPYPERHDTDKADQLKKILEVWQEARESYPHWVILPVDRRRSLWGFTENWTNFIAFNNALSSPFDIELLYELNWRLERCLCPIYNNIIENYEQLLSKYNPFPEVVSSEKSKIIKGNKEYDGLPWDKIQKIWLELYLSVLRFYREEGFFEKWNVLNETFNRVYTFLSPQLVARLHYERCMFAIFSFRLPDIKKQLTSWPINESLPFWEAKRAGLMAEIGDVEEAEKILEYSLSFIRSQLNLAPVTNNYSLTSQEAYVMFLLHYIKRTRAFWLRKFNEQEDMHRQFSERWNNLKRYKCDPWNELQLFDNYLDREPYYTPLVTEKQEFDIGRITRTHHMGKTDTETQNAYSFLRHFEEVGIPFRIPGATLGKKSAAGALLRISKYSSYWAFATLLRIGDAKIVDSIFNRESIHAMDIKTIDGFVDEYLQILQESRSDIINSDHKFKDDFGSLLAEIIPEVLSRLCCKCSLDSKNKLLAFLKEIYSSELRHKYGGIRNLTERIIVSYSHQQQYAIIPALLKFPLINDDDFPTPFKFLTIDEPGAPIELDIPDIVIQNLLQKVGTIKPIERNWASYILVKLYKLGLLNADQAVKLGYQLWGQTDSSGFPADTFFYKFAFLTLPHPISINPVALIKKLLVEQLFSKQEEAKSASIPIAGGNLIPIWVEILGANNVFNTLKDADWLEDEIVGIFNSLVAWWDTDKAYLKEKHPSDIFSDITGEFKSRLRNIVRILSEVILPRLDGNTHHDVVASLQRLLGEFEEYGLPALEVQASCLHVFVEERGVLFLKIVKAISSNKHEIVVDALKAVFAILKSNFNIEKKEACGDFLSLVSQQIKWRQKVGLVSSLHIVSRILKDFPSYLNEKLLSEVIIGLDFLSEETEMEFKLEQTSIGDKLLLRQAAANLACALYKYFSERQEPIPEALNTWKTICFSDNEFAEIRNQWTLDPSV